MPEGESKPAWRPADFSELEARLTEAKTLLQQAMRMIEASEMDKVSSIADMQLDEARKHNDHPLGRRYR